MIKAVIDDLGIPNQDGFFDKDIDGAKYFTEGWQHKTYDKFKDDISRASAAVSTSTIWLGNWPRAKKIFQPVYRVSHELTDFFDAIRAGDRDKVNALLAADPTLLAAKDEKGLSAYIAAKYSQRNDIAALLLEKGIELDFFAACMAGARNA